MFKVLSKIIVVSVIAALISQNYAFGQFNILKSSLNSKYVKRYDGISISPFFSQNFLSLDIEKSNSAAKDTISKLTYKPNLKVSFGVAGSYKNYSLALAIRLPSDKETKEKYGDTEYMDLRLSMYQPRFGADAFYQRFNGFYLENQKKIDTTWTKDSEYFKQSNLAISTFGLNFYYVHSNRFSFKAAFGLNEKQLKSAGSFLLMTSYLNSKIENNRSLFPDFLTESYLNTTTFRNGNFNSFSVAPGYGYTLTNHNIYFTVAFFAGPGIQQQYHNLQAKNKKSYKATIKLNLRSSIGYNSENKFFRLAFGLDTNTTTIEDTNLNILTSWWKFSVGKRF